MSRLNVIIFVLLAVLLADCGSLPKTPEILVQNANEGVVTSEKDVFEVKRPLSLVTEVFKKKAAECFQQELIRTWKQGGLDRRQVIAFKPKMIIGKQHTRFALQARITEGSTEPGDITPDGGNFLVVDAYMVGRNMTRVESSYQQSSFHGAFTAVKLWATGTNMDCPDLTR
jgi:hypothetical protein